MRVLVTGGTGFLGRAITRELLDHGHQVTALSRGLTAVELPTQVCLVHADLLDLHATEKAISDNPADAVIHLAGRTNARESFADPVGYFAANVTGTVNLLSALDHARTGEERPHLVYASTHAVYGSQSDGRLSEQDPTRPESPYAASKVSCEQLIGFQAKAGAIDATILRFFNIAGALKDIRDQDQTRIIPRIIHAAASDSEVPLNGGGVAQRDFVHIGDVATASRLAVESRPSGSSLTFNVGTGRGSSISSIVNEVSTALGREVRTKMMPPVDEPKITIANVDAIKAALGWEPSARSSVAEIVRDAIAESAD